MSEPIWAWIGGGVGLVVGAVLTLAAVTARKRHPASTSLARSGQELIPLPAGGPITGLDFSQAFDSDKFARAGEEEALSYARLHLRDFFADGTTVTLQAVRELLAIHTMAVETSTKSAAAIARGAATIQRHATTGRRLPHVIGSTGRKTQEVMKEVSAGRKLIGGVAAASTIVVSLAHLIATADLARKLRLVDAKLDLLLAYRRIDQSAALERIFYSSKELLSAPLEEAQKTELWRLRGELRELRVVWRRELEYHLLTIEDPAQAAWLDRMFTFQSTTDRHISGKISDGMIQLAMVEFSLRIDRVLAVTSGSWDMSATTLADELAAIERVGALLQEKARFIAVQERRLASAQPMIDGLSSIVTQYRALLVIEPPAATELSGPDRRLTLTS